MQNILGFLPISKDQKDLPLEDNAKAERHVHEIKNINISFLL